MEIIQRERVVLRPDCHPQVCQSHPPRATRSRPPYLFSLTRVPVAKARALLTLSSPHFASSPPLNSIQNYSTTVPITLFLLFSLSLFLSLSPPDLSPLRLPHPSTSPAQSLTPVTHDRETDPRK